MPVSNPTPELNGPENGVQGLKRETFPTSLSTPASAREQFLTERWDSLRSAGIPPLYVSGLANAEQGRAEFLAGLEFLALPEPYPAQLVMADAINSLDDEGYPLNSTLAVCIPRRAGKTTAIWGVILGRMLCRPGYMVTFTAQSGIKAEERFLRDVVDRLGARWDLKDESSPVKVSIRGGFMSLLVKANGSRLTIRAPKAENMRGDANDLTVIDEAQEFDPTESELLLGAILPTFDTKPGAQLLVTGTAGEHRSGLLWDTLQQGREGKPGVGIVEYAADEETPIHEDGDSPEDTTRDPEVWQSAHPGIGFATRLRIVEERAERLPHAQFVREYLGLWPRGGGSGFIASTKWGSARLDGDLPSRPAKFALAFSVHPDRVCASVAVAWRDGKEAHVGLLQHRQGVAWVAEYLMQVHRRLAVPIHYDKLGSNETITANTLSLQPSRPTLVPLGWTEKSDGAALLMKELDAGTLVHHDQPNLNRAVEVAGKRGPKDSKRWTWDGRGAADADITPLEAASLALWAYDHMKEQSGFIFAA